MYTDNCTTNQQVLLTGLHVSLHPGPNTHFLKHKPMCHMQLKLSTLYYSYNLFLITLHHSKHIEIVLFTSFKTYNVKIQCVRMCVYTSRSHTHTHTTHTQLYGSLYNLLTPILLQKSKLFSGINMVSYH
jgi:hypothetical protein